MSDAVGNHQSKKKRVDDQPPPDAGVKPVQLQRRRVWRACESCRRKKIKCDGNEPTCSQCAASKSQCTWLQTKDRAALSRHYVQELEARLVHMESLFQQAAPILEQVGQANGIEVPNLASVMDNTPSSLAHSILPRIKEVSMSNIANDGNDDDMDRPVKMEDEVSDSFGSLALDEHGHTRWIGGSSTMSLVQSFRAITASPLHHRISPMEEDPQAPGPSVNKLYFPATVFFGKVRALPSPEDVEYPDRDLADKLVEAYFAKFHFLMPIIDKPSFMRQYIYLMDNTHDINLARKQTAFIALVCAVFACAARFVVDNRLLSESLDAGGMGMVYYERALILHYISHASTQLEHVQCLLLMSSFLCSVNCLPQAWLIVGQAIRTAQDQGLHRSPRRLLVSPIEKETRRKIWWGAYTLDRMLAIALGRPLGIQDSDCDVELPVDVDDENLQEYFAGAAMSQPSLMKGFVDLCSLYKIGGQVLRQVYALDKCKDYLEPEKQAELQRAVETLDRMLTKWCDDLPVVFKSQPATEKQGSMGAVLCSHYYSILTTLHRNFLPVKRDQPVPRSTAKAVSTARACIRLAPSIKNVVPPSHHLAFFIQNLFSSAVVILLYAMHTSDPVAAQAAMEEAKSCIGVIASWEGHWPGARKCKELLEELTGTASEAIKTGGNGQTRASSSTMSNTPPSAPSPPSFYNNNNSDLRVTSRVAIPMSERVIKSRPNRNRSRDVGLSPVRRSQSGIRFRPDPQRARSTSRKRPLDEDLYQDFGSPYGSVLPSSYPGRSTLSAHGSPVSASSHPSPPGPSYDGTSETSPHMMPTSPYGPLNMPQSPTLPLSPQYDYEYGLPRSPPPPPPERWRGPNIDTNDLKFLPNSQPYSPIAYTPQPNASIDPSYLLYDGSTLGPSMSSLSITPPSSGFAGPGLPFRGLDYIRNYTGGGYSAGTDQDQLWQTFDPNAFGYDPEIAFSLDNLDLGGQDTRWGTDGR